MERLNLLARDLVAEAQIHREALPWHFSHSREL